tara:strand:- start:9 stop:251 length:243 start_codon:yes stop_codon:yes gene_type:complete
MNQQKKSNKKRERIAPLFKTSVSINNNGQLITDHEWVDPKKLLEALDKIAYRHILASVIKHCLSESIGFDEKLNKLLKSF